MSEGRSSEIRGALEVAIEAIGGQPREGQVAMAEAVANALADRHHLLVQAGTGTGKSLAYLVPALMHGKRVLVATATLALQRQLVERDLPRITPALEKFLNRKLSFAIYKGVGNYLCLQKMNSGEQDPDGELPLDIGSLGKEAVKLREWAAKPHVSGDRDDAPEVDRRVWAANSVSGLECMGPTDCSFGTDCFSVKAKAKAQGADIVVTNHTLLAIEIVDAHPILPERDAIILDEAHEFMDRTTQAVTEELTAGRVERAAKMAKKYLPGESADTFQRAADDVAKAINDYANDVASDPTKSGRLAKLPESLESPLQNLKENSQTLLALIAADVEVVEASALAERARVKGAIGEVQQSASKLLHPPGSNVMWFDPTYSTFYSAPLSVSQILRHNLLCETPVIATSATLSVGKNFDAIARSIGFIVDAREIQDSDADDRQSQESQASQKGGEEVIDPSNLQMLDVGSPFDFANQAMLYLPRHLPEPGRDGPTREALTELGELIEAAGGRTLALFSSWRGVEMAHEHLQDVLGELGIPIITQRRGDTVGPLVQRFADQPNSILLGTISLWQGIDVPGSSCTLVVIDRIPFPRPDEPMTAARSAAADEAGGSGFMQVSLPRAALLLAQGTGRLIRSVEDRGVVAILDPRIVTKRYGSILLNSMPPFWRTSDGDVVKEALRRLDSQFLTEKITEMHT